MIEPADPAPAETTLKIEVSGPCDPQILDLRLAQLEREWDVDRAFLAGGAGLGLVATVLGGLRNRLYLAIPLALFGFLWQRVQGGTCPPIEAMRRLGFRTACEIQEERTALKALRRELRHARGRRPSSRPKTA